MKNEIRVNAIEDKVDDFIVCLNVDQEVKYVQKLPDKMSWNDLIYILNSFLKKADKEQAQYLKYMNSFKNKNIKVVAEYFNKTAYVIALWEMLDKQLNLTQKLDDLIDFRKMFGTVIGTMLEMMDRKAIKALIEFVIIPVLTGLLFKKGQ